MTINAIAQPPALTPPLKFVGGKRWLAPKLSAEIMACNPAHYVEPFVGGGAVALALPASLPKTIADTNSTLIDIWRCLKAAPIALIHELGKLEKQFPNTAFGYAKARDALNATITTPRRMWIHRAALALWINARCFNGIWRTNQAGLFNVPWGKYKSPQSMTHNRAELYAAALKHTKIELQDFRKTFHALISTTPDWLARTTVFADPPYDDTFDGYGKDGFDEIDQRELAEWLQFLVGRGVKIWATNSDTKLIRELYGWAEIMLVEERHVVGATGARRGGRACVLIRG